ncbi:MAG: hypothetical protein V3V01_14935 [Acidimicrobiales bacterium]
MRRRTLLRSVQRLLGPGEELIDAAFMWRRHRLMFPYALLAFVATALVAALAGWDDWASRVAIAAAGTAIAVTASSEYRVLVLSTDGLALCRSMRVRQFATKLLKRLPGDTLIEPVGGTMLATDWKIGAATFSVAKNSEKSIEHIRSRVT